MEQLPRVIEYIKDRYGRIVDYGALEKIVKTVKSRMTNISRPGGKEKLRDYLHKLCDFVLFSPLEESNANALLTPTKACDIATSTQERIGSSKLC